MTNKPVYWLSGNPGLDDFGNAIYSNFVDGKTKYGPWAVMAYSPEVRGGHIDSFTANGVGLGQGLGQHYKKQLDGRWLKVGG